LLVTSVMAARSHERGIAAGRGFTLVEMVTVLTIIAIGAAVAMPSLRAALVGQRVRAAATDLTTSLLLARSEAIKRSDPVRVEPRTAEDWNSGWRVVGVTDGDQVDRKDALGDGVQVTRAPGAIVYERHGRLTDPGLVRVEITDTVSTGRNRCVTVDPSGLPRLATGSCP
jgi:type IV fimbrial biogenesis protein FimT